MTADAPNQIDLKRPDGRFYLPGHSTTKSLVDLLRWQTGARRAAWPAWVENKLYPAPAERVHGNALSLTWIGHATALIQTHGVNILTDPFFSLRASPVQFAGPRRVRAPGIPLENLPPIDMVLLSHNHYDHMDLPALARLAKLSHERALCIVTPTGNARHIGQLAANATIHEYGWHEPHLHEAGLTITPTPARHWSKRTFFDHNKALWSAFFITTPTHRIYFAADTGFGDGKHFTLTRQIHGEPDLALIPIGAYEPRWFMAPQHIDPDEAVRAHMLLGAKRSVAIHHATIQLTDEAIDAPARALAEARTAHGLPDDHFRALDVGESWQL